MGRKIIILILIMFLGFGNVFARHHNKHSLRHRHKVHKVLKHKKSHHKKKHRKAKRKHFKHHIRKIRRKAY